MANGHAWTRIAGDLSRSFLPPDLDRGYIPVRAGYRPSKREQDAAYRAAELYANDAERLGVAVAVEEWLIILAGPFDVVEEV